MECGGDGAHIRLLVPFWDSSVADLLTQFTGQSTWNVVGMVHT